MFIIGIPELLGSGRDSVSSAARASLSPKHSEMMGLFRTMLLLAIPVNHRSVDAVPPGHSLKGVFHIHHI